ncbi:MAG: hypothetical protein HY687_05295 [Chloroflexi bacterium]|nr:hypothetical protein [Chloroflexota bacterium]
MEGSKKAGRPGGPPAHHSEAKGVPVPEPSFAPLLLALGALALALAFGLIFQGLVLAVGVVLLLAGLGLWLYEDSKRSPKA